MAVLIVVLGIVSPASLAANEAEERVAAARRQNNDTLLVLALADCAYSHWIAEPLRGISEAQEAITLAERIKFPRGKAKALVALGWCHYVRSEYVEAMRASLQAEQASEESGDKATLGLVHQYRGNLFRRVYKDTERSRAEHLRALALMGAPSSLPDSSLLAVLWLDIGVDERMLNKPLASLEYLRKALEFFHEHSDTLNIAVVYGYMGECYGLLEQHNKAQEYFEREIALGKVQNLSRALTFGYGRLAATLNILEQPQSAISAGLASIAAAERSGTRDLLVETYSALATAYRRLGKFEHASEIQLLLTNLQDSLYADKMRNVLTVQQVNFEAEKSASRLAALDKEKNLQNRIVYGLAAIVIVITFAALFAWRSARAEHKALLLIEEKNRNITQQAMELEALNAQFITANEEIERQLTIQAEQSQQLEISQTEIRQVSDDLVLANQQLSTTNTELALERQALEVANKELSYKNQALAEAEQFRLNMLSTVSHDLKNPINSVIGLTSVLLDNPDHDERTQEILRYINDSAERMGALVRDLLDTAARGAGKITLNRMPTEIADITSGVLAHYIHAAERKKQTIIFRQHEELWVNGDVQRLFQVFDNLVSNAIKYSPLGGTIWITLKKHDGKVLFCIQDEGEGFSDADKLKAFAFFQKLSAQPTGGESSSGIGLAIVQQIVHLHGGNVRIESELGKGATMIVELPLLEG
jgi:signal transduction histidine kinase